MNRGTQDGKRVDSSSMVTYSRTMTQGGQFASLVRLENYMVFPVPEGQCKGLFVTRREATSFEVQELQGGTTSVPFTYRIVAKRKDIQGIRLQRIDPVLARNGYREE